jgi:hypothetical protein
MLYTDHVTACTCSMLYYDMLIVRMCITLRVALCNLLHYRAFWNWVTPLKVVFVGQPTWRDVLNFAKYAKDLAKRAQLDYNGFDQKRITMGR